MEIFFKYFSLTKPKVILLLSVTGLVAYLIPSPDLDLVGIISFVLMGYTSAGGAMAINNYIDRDIDVLMDRTSKRSSIERIDPAWKIIIFGLLLMAIGILIGYLVFNPLTAAFLLFADIFYLTGYSLYLKRTSLASTIIGGIISPTPVFVGYTAALGTLPLEGFLLGAIVFVWTPSHTFAMSAKNYEDYKRANVPMMPVVLGMEKTSFYTLIGGIITIIYGYFVVLKYYIPITEIIHHIILVLISIYFLYTLILFYQKPSPETATICFRRGHTLWLSGIFLLVLF